MSAVGVAGKEGTASMASRSALLQAAATGEAVDCSCPTRAGEALAPFDNDEEGVTPCVSAAAWPWPPDLLISCRGTLLIEGSSPSHKTCTSPVGSNSRIRPGNQASPQPSHCASTESPTFNDASRTFARGSVFVGGKSWLGGGG